MIGGELDSGDIITRDYFPLRESTKVTEAWAWMSRRIPAIFLEAINSLGEDPQFVLDRQSKDPKRALRCYPRLPADGRIDWNRSAVQILRLINASNKPYAGAYCEYEGNRLLVWDAERVMDPENFLAVPGQVTLIGNGFIEVACGDGKLRLLKIEIDGTVASPDTSIKSIRKRLE